MSSLLDVSSKRSKRRRRRRKEELTRSRSTRLFSDPTFTNLPPLTHLVDRSQGTRDFDICSLILHPSYFAHHSILPSVHPRNRSNASLLPTRLRREFSSSFLEREQELTYLYSWMKDNVYYASESVFVSNEWAGDAGKEVGAQESRRHCGQMVVRNIGGR